MSKRRSSEADADRRHAGDNASRIGQDVENLDNKITNVLKNTNISAINVDTMDKLVILLHVAIVNKTLPRHHIFYLYLQTAILAMVEQYGPRFSPTLLDFFGDAQCIGGAALTNFMRGGYTPGQGGRFAFDPDYHNFVWPSKQTLSGNAPAISSVAGTPALKIMKAKACEFVARLSMIESGVSLLHLATSQSTVWPVNLGFDDTTHSPGMGFDSKLRAFVGHGMEPLIFLNLSDLDSGDFKAKWFSPETLNFTSKSTFFGMQTLDGNFSVYLCVEPNDGVSGEARAQQVRQVVRHVNRCKRCEDLRLPCSSGYSRCDTCIDLDSSCDSCKVSNKAVENPMLLPCARCAKDNHHCQRFHVLFLGCDKAPDNRGGLSWCGLKEDGCFLMVSFDFIHDWKGSRNALCHYAMVSCCGGRISMPFIQDLRLRFPSIANAIPYASINVADMTAMGPVYALHSEHTLGALKAVADNGVGGSVIVIPEITSPFPPPGLNSRTESMIGNVRPVQAVTGSFVFVDRSDPRRVLAVDTGSPACVRFFGLALSSPVCFLSVVNCGSGLRTLVLALGENGIIYGTDMRSMKSTDKPTPATLLSRTSSAGSKVGEVSVNRSDLKWREIVTLHDNIVILRADTGGCYFGKLNWNKDNEDINQQLSLNVSIINALQDFNVLHLCRIEAEQPRQLVGGVCQSNSNNSRMCFTIEEVVKAKINSIVVTFKEIIPNIDVKRLCDLFFFKKDFYCIYSQINGNNDSDGCDVNDNTSHNSNNNNDDDDDIIVDKVGSDSLVVCLTSSSGSEEICIAEHLRHLGSLFDDPFFVIADRFATETLWTVSKSKRVFAFHTPVKCLHNWLYLWRQLALCMKSFHEEKKEKNNNYSFDDASKVFQSASEMIQKRRDHVVECCEKCSSAPEGPMGCLSSPIHQSLQQTSVALSNTKKLLPPEGCVGLGALTTGSLGSNLIEGLIGQANQKHYKSSNVQPDLFEQLQSTAVALRLQQHRLMQPMSLGYNFPPSANGDYYPQDKGGIVVVAEAEDDVADQRRMALKRAVWKREDYVKARAMIKEFRKIRTHGVRGVKPKKPGMSVLDVFNERRDPLSVKDVERTKNGGCEKEKGDFESSSSNSNSGTSANNSHKKILGKGHIVLVRPQKEDYDSLDGFYLGVLARDWEEPKEQEPIGSVRNRRNSSTEQKENSSDLTTNKIYLRWLLRKGEHDYEVDGAEKYEYYIELGNKNYVNVAQVWPEEVIPGVYNCDGAVGTVVLTIDEEMFLSLQVIGRDHAYEPPPLPPITEEEAEKRREEENEKEEEELARRKAMNVFKPPTKTKRQPRENTLYPASVYNKE